MANGQETGIETLRAVIARQARGDDWSSVRDFHQGQRSTTALKGRIHDRTPTRLPKHQKALAERGPSIHDRGGCCGGPGHDGGASNNTGSSPIAALVQSVTMPSPDGRTFGDGFFSALCVAH